MKNVEWEKVLEHFKDELPDDTAFLQDYVSGLPQELTCFCKSWTQKGDVGKLNIAKFHYFQD